MKIFLKFSERKTITFQSKASEILIDSVRKLNKENQIQQKIRISCQAFHQLEGAKFGLVQNQIQYYTFLSRLEDILDETNQHFQKLNDYEKHTVSVDLWNLFIMLQSFQLIKWDGMNSIYTWFIKHQSFLQKKEYYLLYLNFCHGLRQQDLSPVVKNIEKIIDYFKVNPLQDLQDRLYFYQGIRSIRPFDQAERKHLKTTLIDLAKEESRDIELVKEFQTIAGDYLELCVDTFFPSIVKYITDQPDESEYEPDTKMLPQLERIYVFLMQQSHLHYFTSANDIDLDNNPDLVGLTLSTKWKHLRQASKALQVLIHFQITTPNHLIWFFKSLDRKAETEQLDLQEGIYIMQDLLNILKYDINQVEARSIYYFLINYMISSINFEDLNTLSIDNSNLALLLDVLLKSVRLIREIDEATLRSAIEKLVKWIKSGELDRFMKKTDWFDLKQVCNHNKFEDLDYKINKELE